jgi:hypothetical protein
MAADKERSRRFGEPGKFIPVIFVVAVIAVVYGIYTYVCEYSRHLPRYFRHTFSDFYKLICPTTGEIQTYSRWA